MFLKPLDGLCVQVVGGLVKQQHVGLAHEELAERDASSLTPGEGGGLGAEGRQAERSRCLVELAVEVPCVLLDDLLVELCHLVGELHHLVIVGDGPHELCDLVVASDQLSDGGDSCLEVLGDRLLVVELWLLREESRGEASYGLSRALELFVHSGDDLEEGALASAVAADDADLGAFQEGEGDALEDLVLSVRFPKVLQLIDDLVGHFASEDNDAGPRCQPRGLLMGPSLALGV